MKQGVKSLRIGVTRLRQTLDMFSGCQNLNSSPQNYLVITLKIGTVFPVQEIFSKGNTYLFKLTLYPIYTILKPCRASEIHTIIVLFKKLRAKLHCLSSNKKNEYNNHKCLKYYRDICRFRMCTLIVLTALLSCCYSSRQHGYLNNFILMLSSLPQVKSILYMTIS